MKSNAARGYQIIDLGLALPHLELDFDTQVRCLSLLLGNIGNLFTVPNGILFELIPVEYLGGPYPAIGLYTETFVDTDQNLSRLSFVITDRLMTYINETGVNHLVELAQGETVRWQDVLN